MAKYLITNTISVLDLDIFERPELPFTLDTDEKEAEAEPLSADVLPVDVLPVDEQLRR